MEIILLSLIILLTGLTMLFSGRWVKRNWLFSIYVPDEQQYHPKVSAIKSHFKRNIVLTAVIAAIINIIILYTLSAEWGIGAFIIILNAMILVEIYSYSRYYEQLKTLKQREEWMKGKQVVRATDTTVRQDLHVLPNMVYAIPVMMLLLATVYTVFNYHLIPERIAVHWGIDNKPDRYEEKSLVSVFMPAAIGLFTLLIMLAASKSTDLMPLKLNPASRKASADYEVRIRKNNSYMMFVIAVIMALLFSFITIQQVIIPNENLPAAFLPVVLIGTSLQIIAGMYLQWQADKDYRRAAAENDKAPYHDDSNYVMGLFYYNKQDPNVWVPKVSQFGMTLNMARIEAKILTVLFLIVLLGSILLIEWLAK